PRRLHRTQAEFTISALPTASADASLVAPKNRYGVGISPQMSLIRCHMAGPPTVQSPLRERSGAVFWSALGLLLVRSWSALGPSLVRQIEDS
ncbi:MAG TPA: hypothetical protein VMU77_03645, partial [Acidimicrobiales bacterium]|nr:hypothetical protein [Acidimicrobiales bacterium]